MSNYKKKLNPSVLMSPTKNPNVFRAFLTTKSYNAITSAELSGSILLCKLTDDRKAALAAAANEGGFGDKPVPEYELVIMPANEDSKNIGSSKTASIV